MSRHIYTLKKPAAWHKELWREALPLGNGYTGILIPGSIGKERVIFNRYDLWEGGSDRAIPDVTAAHYGIREALDRGDYTAANQENMSNALREAGYGTGVDCPHNLGWLDMEFEPTALFTHYRRGVNMQTGESFVEFTVDGCRYRREAFVSRADDVTVMRMSADGEFTTTYDFRLYNRTVESETAEAGLYRASANGYTSVRVEVVGSCETTVNGSGLTVTGKEYLLLIRCGSHGSDPSLTHVQGRTYEDLLAAHTAIHTPLYDSVTVELVPEEALEPTNEQLLSEAYDTEVSAALLERLWRFGRYLFISGSAPSSYPVPLYGLWHGDHHLAWSQYVANENVEITYWHTMAGGLSYAIPPLLRYYTSKMDKLRECARQMFGCRGIWISAYTTPNSSGPSVAVSVILNWISCAGWLCRHFWEYYLYTKDMTLLREEILPFMHEAALFYLDYAVEDGDYIRLYPSVSPENTPAGHLNVVAQNATMDFAILKELLTNLLDGMEITGLYAEEAESFRALFRKIPPYMLNEDGAVKEWMSPEIKDQYYHRHLSHIYPVFPGCEVTKQSQPDLFEAFKKAVQLRKLGAQSGWSMAHMASIYARMGEGDLSLGCIDAMAKSVIHDSLLTTHNDWRNMGTSVYWDGEAFVQLDAAFGVVNALQEMLFCAQRDGLSILPALPERLPIGKVCGLAFPEGRVDIAWEYGSYVQITVHADRFVDTDLLVVGQEPCRITVKERESKTVRFPLGINP